MTQTLDVGERLSQFDSPSAAKGAPTSTVQTGAKLGTFAITFGIAFMLLYTVYERLNWPLFTYHPVLGNLDFWRQPTGVGPPMFWYGWIGGSARQPFSVALSPFFGRPPSPGLGFSSSTGQPSTPTS
jgi:hypothetical protein